jgi:hypothetical protein
VGARHRMPEPPGRSLSAIGPLARRTMYYCVATLRVARIALLCAVVLASLTLRTGESEESADTAAIADPGPRAPEPVSQEGVLIAVSADSVTARSANGYTQTYLITPGTTLISVRGSQPVSATSSFRVNEEVEIVGTATRGCRALATAVADRNLGRGDDQPMDYGDGQP